MLRQQSIDASVVEHRSDRGLFLFLVLTFMAVIIVGTTVAYFPTSMTGPSFEKIGQRMFWLIVVLAIVIGSMHGFRMAILVGLATGAMFLFRVSSTISPGTSFLTNMYHVSYSLIIMVATASFYTKAGWLYEQGIKCVIFLSVPILLLQVLGVSESVHFMGTSGMELEPTFRIGVEELTASRAQLRPMGVFFANSITAIVIVFAIALRLSQPIGRVTIYDMFLLYLTFLTMAKIAIVFLVLALSMRFAVSKEKMEKLRVMRLALVASGLLLLHWLLFPGVVEWGLSLSQLYVSAGVRLLDFALSIGVTEIPFLGINVSGLGELQIDAAFQDESLAAQLRVSYGPDQAIGTSTGIGFLFLVSPLLAWLWLQIRRIEKKLFLSADDRRRSVFLLLAFLLVLMTQDALGLAIIPFLFGPVLVPLLRERETGPRRFELRADSSMRNASK